MTIGRQFKIKNYQQPLENTVIFDLVSPISGKINGEECQISKITISGIEIEGENLKEGREVNFESVVIDSRITFPDINRKDTIFINGSGRPVKVRIKKSKKELNQEEVISWIKNYRGAFDLTFPFHFDYVGNLVNVETGESIHMNNVENIAVIKEKIKECIRDNPSKFFLCETISYDRDNESDRGWDRWWSQEIPDGDPRQSSMIVINRSSERGGATISGIREICHGSGAPTQKALFPGFFTVSEYEELKNLLPDDRACKVRGCYNNHCGSASLLKNNPGLSEEKFSIISNPETCTKVVNGKCTFHKIVENLHLNLDNLSHPENQTAEDASENERKRIIRNALNNNGELKRMLEANKNIISEEDFVKISLKEWINDDKTVNLEQIKNFFVENGWTIPKPEEPVSNQEETENNPNPEPTTPPPLNNNNSALQTTKNNAIQEIINALNQEPKLTTEHDLSEINRDWKKKINAADNENEIINIKERVMVDIAAKRNNKKEAENIVNNLETEGKDADQLKKQLEEVEKSKGQQSYEDNQSGIDNLKDELSKKVSEEEYNQIMVDAAKNNMVKYDINEDELDTKTKKNWQKLKSGEIKGKEQINEIEKQIAKNVGEKGSEKKLNKILQEAQQAIKSGNENKIKAVKNKLYNFLASTNIHEKSLFSQRKDELNKLLKDLENYLDQKQTSSDQFPWKIVIPVALVLIIITFTLGVIIYRKRKKKLKS